MDSWAEPCRTKRLVNDIVCKCELKDGLAAMMGKEIWQWGKMVSSKEEYILETLVQPCRRMGREERGRNWNGTASFFSHC